MKRFFLENKEKNNQKNKKGLTMKLPLLEISAQEYFSSPLKFEYLTHLVVSQLESNLVLIGKINLSVLPNLHEADISYQKIDQIIIKNPHLTKLNCSHNQLTSLLLYSSPDVPCSLKELDCSNNEIQDDKITGQSPKLTVLKLSNNHLSWISLKNLISNPSALIYLDICNNKFDKNDLEDFSNFTNLETLLIGNKSLVDKGEKWNRLSGSLAPLAPLQKLTELYIGNTDIDSGLEYLPASLKKIDFGIEWDSTNRSNILQLSLSMFDFSLENWREYKEYSQQPKKIKELLKEKYELETDNEKVKKENEKIEEENKTLRLATAKTKWELVTLQLCNQNEKQKNQKLTAGYQELVAILDKKLKSVQANKFFWHWRAKTAKKKLILETEKQKDLTQKITEQDGIIVVQREELEKNAWTLWVKENQLNSMTQTIQAQSQDFVKLESEKEATEKELENWQNNYSNLQNEKAELEEKQTELKKKKDYHKAELVRLSQELTAEKAEKKNQKRESETDIPPTIPLLTNHFGNYNSFRYFICQNQIVYIP